MKQRGQRNQWTKKWLDLCALAARGLGRGEGETAVWYGSPLLLHFDFSAKKEG